MDTKSKTERKIFIGSTTQHLELARRIQQKINDYQTDNNKFNAKIWNEGDFFTPGQYGLTSLIRSLTEFDFAVLILTPDDAIKLAGKGTKKIPRDNLLFELGLCYGLLGEGHVIALTEKTLKPKDLLSDFLGITFIPFDLQDIDTNAGTISSAVTKIIGTFTKLDKTKSDTSGYFKQKMISWRKEREEIKYKQIEDGNWTIWLLKEDYYLRYIFGGVLSTLEKGDCYSTISNLDFWASLGVDSDEFISNNLEALKKGVEVNRVILIRNQIFETSVNDPYRNVPVQTLVKIVDRFKEIRKDNRKHFEKMKLFFLITSDYNFDMGNTPSPFAVIENKKHNDHALITPMIEQPINQVMITFKPVSETKHRPNSYDSLSKKFKRLITDNRKKSLDDIDSYLNQFRK